MTALDAALFPATAFGCPGLANAANGNKTAAMTSGKYLRNLYMVPP
jgi:hypothetical protein